MNGQAREAAGGMTNKEMEEEINQLKKDIKQLQG